MTSWKDDLLLILVDLMGLPTIGPSYLNGPKTAYATAHPGDHPVRLQRHQNPQNPHGYQRCFLSIAFATLQVMGYFQQSLNIQVLRYQNKPQKHWPSDLWTYLSLDDRYESIGVSLVLVDLNFAGPHPNHRYCDVVRLRATLPEWFLLGWDGMAGWRWLNIKTCWIAR